MKTKISPQLEAKILSLGPSDPLPPEVDAVFVGFKTVDVRMKPDRDHPRYWSVKLTPRNLGGL